MKSIIASIAVCCAFVAQGAAPTVLVFIDSTLHSNVTAEVATWTNQVNREGYYTVDLRERPRALGRNATNRLDELAAIRTIIDGADPAAVQFFGAVAMPVSGMHNLDGHGGRPADTDAPFMQDGYVPEDVGAWGSSVIGTNAPGDGYWDMLYVTSLARPVARVSFQSLTESDPSVVWGSCKAGPQCPAVDEVEAFKDYIRRNMAYRQGVWRPARIGYIVGSLWSGVSGSVSYCTSNIPSVSWTYSGTQPGGAEGRKLMFLWENCAIGSEMASLFDSRCQYVEPFWLNTYRSFMIEAIQHTWSSSYIRRWNQYALVSTWGSKFWTCSASSRTVFDSFAGTLTAQGGLWNVAYQCWGDGTLPVIPIPYGIQANTLNVGSIQAP